MTSAFINRIATAVPPNDVHEAFVRIRKGLIADPRKQLVFEKLAERSQIERRWSYLVPDISSLSASLAGRLFYAPDYYPTTGERMRHYEIHAPLLAEEAVRKLDLDAKLKRITHLVITSCTGFSAPGIDLELVERFGLNPSVERTIVGFMGCHAAINALKIARHIVRSEPQSKVLLVSIELCTLHLQGNFDLEQMMPYLLFADGCAAALVSSEPEGFEIETFFSAVFPEASDQMAWHIRDLGFDMVLSSRIPNSVGEALKAASRQILYGASPGDFDLWAVHPGGRAILDAVEAAFGLPSAALDVSRKVLREFGNMSSATVLFVLKALFEANAQGGRGCAMSFGPGLTAETMLFKAAA